METIRIGKKNKSEYTSSVLYAFKNGHESVVVAALGGQVSKAFDVAEQVGEVIDVNNVESEQFEKNDLLGIKITLEKEGRE